MRFPPKAHSIANGICVNLRAYDVCNLSPSVNWINEKHFELD